MLAAHVTIDRDLQVLREAPFEDDDGKEEADDATTDDVARVVLPVIDARRGNPHGNHERQHDGNEEQVVCEARVHVAREVEADKR